MTEAIENNLDQQLFIELKNHLQITWDDNATNTRLQTSIKNGKRFFNELCEHEFSFEEGSTERELLMERCRYDWNNALDEFKTNYKSDLSSLIMDIAILQYEEAKADEEQTNS